MRVLAVLTVALGLLVGAGTARGQSISGTLTDAGTGLPLGNAPGEPRYGIAVYNIQGGVVASLAAGPDGTYQTISLLPGTYFVKGYDISGSYVTELHSDISCVADDCVVTAGTPSCSHPVRSSSTSRSPARGVSPGRCAGRAAVRRSPAFTSISTTLLEAPSAASPKPRSGPPATARTPSKASPPVSTSPAPMQPCSALSKRPTSSTSFTAACRARTSRSSPNVSVLDGTPIAVAAAATTSGIDFSLDAGGGISGRVTDAAGQALHAVRVDRIYRRPHGRDRRDLVRRVLHSGLACR